MTSTPFPAPAPLPASPSPDQPAGEQRATGAPSSPVPPDRPPLRRSSTDTMLGGVCGGLAEYSGIESLLWRVGFVALTLAGGSGLLVYLLLWILMPPAPPAAGRRPGAVEGLVGRMHTAVVSAFRPEPRNH
jgi:phage shock protein PspC (stress-responsive transcriptional regulator)